MFKHTKSSSVNKGIQECKLISMDQGLEKSTCPLNNGHCDLICKRLFILILLNTLVSLMLHKNFQPNIPNHSGEIVNFIGHDTFKY